MIQSMHGETLVGTLLNTLEAERYARGPVLLAIVDELCASGGLEVAADSALAILEELETGEFSELDFAPRVRLLRQLVQALSARAEAEVGVNELRPVDCDAGLDGSARRMLDGAPRASLARSRTHEDSSGRYTAT